MLSVPGGEAEGRPLLTTRPFSSRIRPLLRLQVCVRSGEGESRGICGDGDQEGLGRSDSECRSNVVTVYFFFFLVFTSEILEDCATHFVDLLDLKLKLIKKKVREMLTAESAISKRTLSNGEMSLEK